MILDTINSTCGILQFHTETGARSGRHFFFPHPGGFDGDSPPWLGSVKLKIRPTSDPTDPHEFSESL